jgi:hypothetical protein
MPPENTPEIESVTNAVVDAVSDITTQICSTIEFQAFCQLAPAFLTQNTDTGTISYQGDRHRKLFVALKLGFEELYSEIDEMNIDD